MGYYEMDTPQVHTSGREVTTHAPTASGLARRYETVLSGAETSVGHRTVVQAVRRYSSRWKPAADRVASRVESLGISTSGSAVTVSDTDLEAENHLRNPSQFYLTRSINEVYPGA